MSLLAGLAGGLDALAKMNADELAAKRAEDKARMLHGFRMYEARFTADRSMDEAKFTAGRADARAARSDANAMARLQFGAEQDRLNSTMTNDQGLVFRRGKNGTLERVMEPGSVDEFTGLDVNDPEFGIKAQGLDQGAMLDVTPGQQMRAPMSKSADAYEYRSVTESIENPDGTTTKRERVLAIPKNDPSAATYVGDKKPASGGIIDPFAQAGTGEGGNRTGAAEPARVGAPGDNNTAGDVEQRKGLLPGVTADSYAANSAPPPWADGAAQPGQRGSATQKEILSMVRDVRAAADSESPDDLAAIAKKLVDSGYAEDVVGRYERAHAGAFAPYGEKQFVTRLKAAIGLYRNSLNKGQ